MSPRKKRTDRHCPTNIRPDEYEFRGVFAYPNPANLLGYMLKENDEARRAHAQAGGMIFHAPNGGCGICGAAFCLGVAFVHKPTNEWIEIGWICADKLEMVADEACGAKRTMDAWRKAWKKASLADRRRDAFWVSVEPVEGLKAALAIDHPIIQDIRAKGERYGSISQAQIDMVFRLAQPKEEAHVPAPEGRVLVAGEVVGKKTVASDFGDTLKVTVRVATEAGCWLAFGTMPKALWQAERGARVEFTATLSRGRDPWFAFFKRPAQARLVAS